MNETRIKILRIHPVSLNTFLQQKEVEIVKPLPRGAEVVGTFIDILTGEIVLHVKHESFDPIAEGGLIPEFKGGSRTPTRGSELL